MSAQYTQTIKGTVTDKDSGIPLIGATVIVLNVNPVIGCLTDPEGNFRLEHVIVGRQSLQISYIGYESRIISEVLVESGKELFLTVELSLLIPRLKMLVITDSEDKGKPRNEMALVSSRSFTIDEGTKMAGNFNDISRIAQSYAGVGASDMSNELVIRGNSSKGLLWRLEGVEVPNLNHLAAYGSSGGGLSLLSVNVLRNSDFYTGAFPAEFGNATSGVFDIRLRNGNNEKREYAIQAGFMGLEATAEGPFTKKSKSSYLLNYRYSTTGILNLIGLNIGGVALPSFHDLTLKINIPLKGNNQLIIFGIGGISSVSVPALKDSAKWKSKEDRFSSKEISDVLATGIIHQYFLGEKTLLTSAISYSGNSLKDENDSLDNFYQLHNTFSNSLAESAVRVSTKIQNTFNARNTIKSGVIYSQLIYNLYSEDKVIPKVYVDQSGSTGMAQFYVAWKHRFSQKFMFNSGIYLQHFLLNQQTTFEPRFSFQCNISSVQSVALGAGLHSKLEPLMFYFSSIQDSSGNYSSPNKNLESAMAQHYVFSYSIQPAENWQIKTEVYYQYLYNVPVENDLRSGFSTLNYSAVWGSDLDNKVNVPLVNKGTGRNYGAELTVEKFLSKNYYFMTTVSIYESKYKALDGIERNSRYNGNFITNIVAGKEYKVGKSKQNAIVIDLKLVWSGGSRLTPIDLEQSRITGTTQFFLDKRYSERGPDYMRADFKFGYRKNKIKSSYYVFLDIQNITNQQNVFTRYYDPAKDAVVTYYHLGLIPMLNYRVKF